MITKSINYECTPFFVSQGHYVESEIHSVKIVPQTPVVPKTPEKSSSEPTNFETRAGVGAKDH